MTSSPTPSLPLSSLLLHTADAVQAVRQGRSLNDALARCPAPARPGTQALSFQVLRTLGTAQALRERLAPRRPPPEVEALMLCALALLAPAPEGGAPPYPEHTLVDQAVRAVRQRSPRGRNSGAFVNAVLRRFVREREALLAALQDDPVAVFNHPAWWIERTRRDWPEHWRELLAANNRRAPMTLRVNARRQDTEAYRQRLAQAGIAARRPAPLVEGLDSQALVLDEPRPVSQLPGFDVGEVSVQDAAAQLAASLLVGRGERALRPGARVLDACAAPGGKTGHLLELADLDLLALDSDAGRLQRVDETLQRLGLVARTQVADARDTASWWDGRRFDAILLDAPCTASGIVRRHPDVRWLRRPGDIAALARVQAGLLDALWPLLEPGGRLLYATCSIFPEEGREQIDAFLQRQPDARGAADLPAPGHLLPLADNAGSGAAPDGFFLALLDKV